MAGVQSSPERRGGSPLGLTEGQFHADEPRRQGQLPLHHSSVVPLPVPGRI